MNDLRNMIRVASAARQQTISPADLARAEAILHWQAETLAQAKQAYLPTQPAIQAMVDYLSCGTGDAIARMYSNQMMTQFAQLAKPVGLVPAFSTSDEWLLAMNYVIQRAPEFTADKIEQFFFPMSSLFVFYMFTPAGASLFRVKAFNVLLGEVLNSWCQFLSSGLSVAVLNPNQEVPATQGWLSPAAQDQFCLEQCENYRYLDDPKEPYWGFKSFNDFFHREWNLKTYRPLAGEGDESVVVAANDGTVYRISNDVDACAAFWTKGQEYSLVDMLDGSPSTGDFVGGDVLQSFLDGSDYHRWHAPISGTVIEARIISGLTFSELLSEGLDLSAGTDSQGYQAMVNTRGLVIIDSPEMGKVAVLPTGITEISSITLLVEVGQKVTKGEELGYFSYGGSTLVLAFEKGLISAFVAQEPPADAVESNADSAADCKTSNNCSAQDGCLMVGSQIAVANIR